MAKEAAALETREVLVKVGLEPQGLPVKPQQILELRAGWFGPPGFAGSPL